MPDALFPSTPDAMRMGQNVHPVWVLFVLEDVLECLQAAKMNEAAALLQGTIRSIEMSIDAAMMKRGEEGCGTLVAFPKAQLPKPDNHETKLSGVDG